MTSRIISRILAKWPFKKPQRSEEDITVCYASGLPKTHSTLVRHVVGEKGYVNYKTTYVRYGDADAKELLRSARRELYEKAVDAGGNALAEESWTCTIKDRNGVYTVKIRYRGKAIISGRMDPHEPVNLNDALAFDDPDEDFEPGNRSSWRRFSFLRNEPNWQGVRRTSLLML